MGNRPTFRLLDGAYFADEHHSLQRPNVSLGSTGILLAESSTPGSPLALDAEDGSLGRLALPRGMAVSAQGALLLLMAAEARIQRYDPADRRFESLEGIGGPGMDARRFDGAQALAIAGNSLYIADRGNRRVQEFDQRSLALRRIWLSLDAADVCSTANLAYVLDQEKGQVFRLAPGKDSKVPVVDSRQDAGRWSRVLVDTEGSIYLFDAGNKTLSIYTAGGSPAEEAKLAGDVRDRFVTPAVTFDASGFFSWAGSVFDSRGVRRVSDPAAPLGKPLYQREGVWISSALDSNLYRCPWDRIELDADLPTGTRLRISTCTDNSLLPADMIASSNSRWEICCDLSADDRFEATGQRAEFLVAGERGQYLWLRIELASDGFATPAIRQLRIHFPRQSYLDYLPAIYSAEEEGRRFLEKFLAVFKTEWDALEARNEDIAAYFDPLAVPDTHTDWLGQLLASPLEQSWTSEQKRRLLAALPKIYPKLGTAEGLRDFLRIYLENMGRPLAEEFPIVVEGFRRRRQLEVLGLGPLGRAGNGSPLWSAGVVGRLQIGEYARVGEARIVSTGSPDTDAFRVYAHRFQVFVPASSVRTASEQRKLRRALEIAKPAHTEYELMLVSPRLRVGVQSSVGIDTILGDYPRAYLAAGNSGEESAPDAPAPNRLGFDTLLAPFDKDISTLHLSRRGMRAGVNTILN